MTYTCVSDESRITSSIRILRRFIIIIIIINKSYKRIDREFR